MNVRISQEVSGKDFPGLELLRFFCAITVIMWHYQHFFPLVNDFQRSAQPFYPGLFVAYNWGNYAVEIFWALSGFIFFWKYAQPVHDGQVTAGKFFLLRFSRLYPLHIATLAVVIALQWVYSNYHNGTFVYSNHDIRHFILNIFMASNWGFHKGFSFNGPIWSVSVEVLAYVTFFAIARRRQFNGRLVAGIVVFLIIAKMALPWVKDIVLSQLYFFIGGAVHLLLSHPRIRPALAIAGSAALALVFVGVNWATNGKVHTFAVIFVSVTLLMTFAQMRGAGRLDRLFSNLGNLTYSSYLIHFPVQLGFVILTDQLGLARDIYYRPEALIIFLLVTFALAQASFHLFERPAQDWLRSKFSKPVPQPLPIA